MISWIFFDGIVRIIRLDSDTFFTGDKFYKYKLSQFTFI